MRLKTSVPYRHYWQGLIVAVALVVLMVIPLAADPVVWSWEQELEPLDILAFVEDLPCDKWIEIDEVTCRRLFEDVIQRSLEHMQIDGGHFEQMLRDRFFYFTPEREYYYPPYEETVSEREVLFPIKIMREQNKYCSEVINIKFGRFSDDGRDLNIIFKDGKLNVVGLDKELYYPGEVGPKKTMETLIGFYPTKVLGLEAWLNNDRSIFIGSQRLFEYELSNSTPVVDNTAEQQPLGLMGIDILFDLPYQNWSAYGASLFQTYNGIVCLLEKQLDIADFPYDLYRLLWFELLYYADGVAYFGMDTEFFNAKRLHTFDDKREEFLFNGGNAHTLRTVDLTLTTDTAPEGYGWGVESMVLTHNILVSDDEVGQEIKELTIRETPSGIVLECWVTQFGEDEEQIARWQIARFEEGNPLNLAIGTEE